MVENKNNFAIVAGLVVIALLLVWQGWQKSADVRVNEISVSGSANLDVVPDESQILLHLETTALNPKDAQDKNSERAAQVVAALVQFGVAKSDIETTGYRVEIIREWNPKTQRNEDKGYRAVHSLKVTTLKLADVGKIVEIAVNNGVNNVDNVLFVLSKDKLREVKGSLLSLASKNAREKADALAGSLNVGVGKIRSVSESFYEPGPVYARGDFAESVMAAKVAPPISPSDVSVQAQVSIVFEIKQ